MKVQNNISLLNNPQSKDAKANNKTNYGSNVNFTGGVDTLVKFWEAVDRGGLAASFTVQDMFGTNIPRTWDARNKGKEYTGKNNWVAVAENGIREFTTGPSMFAVPAGILYASMKMGGKAHGVPVESINDFSKIIANNKSSIDISSIEAFRKSFYNAVLNSTFSNFDNVSENIDIEKYVNDIMKMEKAPKKGLIKNILGKSNPNSKEELLEGLINSFVKTKKANTKNYPDFLSAKVLDKSSEIPFEKLLDRMNKYSDDFFKSLKKSSSPDVITDGFVNSFAKKRMGGRFTTNIAMGVFTAAFMWFIPKLYTIGKVNPETDPVKQKANEINNAKTKAVQSQKAQANPVRANEAFEQIKQGSKAQTQNGNDSQSNQNTTGEPSFAGGGISRMMSNLGDKVAPEASGKLSGFASKVESDWINVARPVFLTLISAFTVLPRVVQSAKRDIQTAKDNNEPVQWDETANILRRDITSVITILFAMKGIGALMAHAASKKTGVVLTNQILPKNMNPFKKFLNFFNSEGGVQVLSKNQNASRLSNFSNADEVGRFFADTEQKGGNLYKLLHIDANPKKGKTSLLYTAAEKLFGKDVLDNKKLSADELKQILKNKAQSDEFKEFIGILNDKSKNPLLKHANSISAVFNTLSLGIVVTFLGFGLPKINDLIIKKKYLKDHKEDNGNHFELDSKKLKENIKPDEQQAFQYFLGTKADN